VEPTERTSVLVCMTCRSATDRIETPCSGAVLADATTSAAISTPDICVLRVRCLGNCTRGPSAAIRRSDAWTYVFGGLDPMCDADALIAGARLLANAHDGLMPWRGRPEALKRGLIARVPPWHFTGEPPS
jgi:predicted metal-binding protein